MVLPRCLKEARPCVQGIFLLRFCVAAAMGARPAGHADPHRLVAGAAVWQAAIFFVYLLNGVLDVREDRINGSGRPIASGRLSRRAAAGVAAGAGLVSVAGAWFLGPPVVAAVAVALLIGWQYSAAPLYLKRSSAGTAAAVGVLGLLTYGMGFVTQAGPGALRAGAALPVFAVTMSAWMAFVGAPAKDLSDVTGDAAAGRRTLAAVRGEPVARRAVTVAALGIAVAFAAVAVPALPPLRWAAVAVATGAVAIAVLCRSRAARGSRARRRAPYRAFMLTQYAANLGALSVLIG